MLILNLTQHKGTPEQGVEEPRGCKQYIQKLLTFDTIPTIEDIAQRAMKLAEIAVDHDAKFAMIGGAPYLMSELERELIKVGIAPIYSFSNRVVIEEINCEDGVVKKQVVFKHVGWVYVK